MVNFLCSCKGKKINDAIVIGVKDRGLCKLKGHTDSSLTTSTISPCELWHRILAHVNYKTLTIVRKVVTGPPEIQINYEGVCKGCAQGKNTNNPFASSNNKPKGVLDIVYSYVCKPMSDISLNGYVYYASFIDDYSHETWIYFLKGKDEVFGNFKEW